jgi:23S rRNA (cytidine1920-2'-O)/16S rRNA (cytidine1409-2'-O)-methyltransferase
MRADLALVARGLAASRSAARRLIDDGAVQRVSAQARQRLERASAEVTESDQLEVTDSVESRYASRAGAKLAAALSQTALECRGLVALDVGQSTGGFTDCLLQAGVARVVGIDVGHGQLRASLRDDPRVVALEGLNARQLQASDLGAALPTGGFELIVADVSFISLTKVLPSVLRLAAAQATLLALVKPQFELGAQALDGRGIVRDPDPGPRCRDLVERCLAESRWQIQAFFESALVGGDGNREFFVLAQRVRSPSGSASGSPPDRPSDSL